MTILRNEGLPSADEGLVQLLANQPNRRQGRERAISSAASCDRGAVTVEYAVLLAVVSMGCVLAIIGLGVPLVRVYQASQAWLMLPVP